MTRTFEPPAYVQDNIAARNQVLDDRRRELCVYAPKCTQPAVAARGGNSARCAEHTIAEFGQPIIPDPTRTLAALRRRAGINPDGINVGRTILDTRAEESGRRASAARRAAARGQVGGEAA